MLVLVVVLLCWLVLTAPAAVLMGKCIARGLSPHPDQALAPRVPDQRSTTGASAGFLTAQAGHSRA